MAYPPFGHKRPFIFCLKKQGYSIFLISLVPQLSPRTQSLIGGYVLSENLNNCQRLAKCAK